MERLKHVDPSFDGAKQAPRTLQSQTTSQLINSNIFSWIQAGDNSVERSVALEIGILKTMKLIAQQLPSPLQVAAIIGITSPAIYYGITLGYSKITIKPLLTHAPTKLLAKQWLQAYQYGPDFVPPLVISGTLSNAALAFFAGSFASRIAHVVAALSIFSIIPYTILYMEPNINGAGKWKAQQILQEDGYKVEENGPGMPDVFKHTGTPSARQWAEKTNMKDIVSTWGQINSWRYWIAMVAAVASGYGSFHGR